MEDGVGPTNPDGQTAPLEPLPSHASIDPINNPGAGAVGPCFTPIIGNDCAGTGPVIPITPGSIATTVVSVGIAGATAANVTTSGSGGFGPVPDYVYDRAKDPLNASPPAPGFEWRGNGPPGTEQGSWYNPQTEERIHPDMGGGHGPHIDYQVGRNGPEARVYPDGRVEPK
jgi:hypothetical protein